MNSERVIHMGGIRRIITGLECIRASQRKRGVFVTQDIRLHVYHATALDDALNKSTTIAFNDSIVSTSSCPLFEESVAIASTQRIHIIDVEAKAPVREFAMKTRQVTYHPRSDSIVAYYQDKEIGFVDFREKKKTKTSSFSLPEDGDDDELIRGFQFYGSNALLFSTNKGKICLWESRNPSAVMMMFENPTQTQMSHMFPLADRRTFVWNGQRETMIVGDKDGNVIQTRYPTNLIGVHLDEDKLFVLAREDDLDG